MGAWSDAHQETPQAMGLYIDSPSIVSIVTNSHEEKLRIESQMRHVARTLHSHPGPLGAQIAAGILNDSQMYRSWLVAAQGSTDQG
jgi:aspartate/tyrosine/aromatic aminotransferase